MAKRIEWSDKAIDRLSQAIKYLKLEVSQTAAANFADLIDKRIAFIEKYPTSGRKVANRKTIRFILVGKHYRLYYRVHGSVLYITALFDTRQDPSKRPLSMKVTHHFNCAENGQNNNRCLCANCMRHTRIGQQCVLIECL